MLKIAAREQSQLFTVNGTFTVPNDRTKVYVTCAAGGGGGGGGQTGAGRSGGGGGGGDSIWRRDVAVTAGTTYTITIGTGGAGGAHGASTGSDGSDGTSSSFDVLLSMTGGHGGKGAQALQNGNGGLPGGPGATAGGTAFALAQIGADGGASVFQGGKQPPGPKVCIAATLLLLAAYKFKLFHLLPLVFPFPIGVVTVAPYGSGGAGGSNLADGGTGANGYMMIEW